MKVFVINIDEKRFDKYDGRYTRWEGCNGREELDIDWINKNYNFYWNCNEDLRKCVAGCSESHLSLMRHIIKEKLNNVIVLEDDALLDFDRVIELENVKDFCYIGGRFQSPILKNKLDRDTILCHQGLNFINTERYIITGGHSYYFDSWETCRDIYFDIQHRNKKRAIDVEFKRIQKTKQKITQFIYPAIATLHLPDAKNGFTFNDKRYKLKDNNFLY